MRDSNPTRSLTDGRPVPSFISFRGDIITVITNNTADIGAYMILLTGCVNSNQAYYYQEVIVNNNSPPSLNLTVFNYTYELGKKQLL